MGQLPLGLICHGDTQAGQQRLAPRGCGDEKCGPAQGKGKREKQSERQLSSAKRQLRGELLKVTLLKSCQHHGRFFGNDIISGSAELSEDVATPFQLR